MLLAGMLQYIAREVIIWSTLWRACIPACLHIFANFHKNKVLAKNMCVTACCLSLNIVNQSYKKQ